MKISTYYPYRSEAARDACFAHLDSVAAATWPIVSEERMVPTTYGPTFVRISGRSTAPPIGQLAIDFNVLDEQLDFVIGYVPDCADPGLGSHLADGLNFGRKLDLS